MSNLFKKKKIFSLKIIKKVEFSGKLIYEGKEALSASVGTIFEVANKPSYPNNNGEVIIRISREETSKYNDFGCGTFKTIAIPDITRNPGYHCKIGDIWGITIKDYTFKLLPFAKESDYK